MRVILSTTFAVLIGVSLVGCAKTPDSSAKPAATTLQGLDVQAFEQRLTGDPKQVVINVHVPYEGEIAGTQLFAPFDAITANKDLPADRATPLLLYCRTGNMSRTAGNALIAAGYTNVAHLDGGMVAWEAAGKILEQRTGR